MSDYVMHLIIIYFLLLSLYIHIHIDISNRCTFWQLYVWDESDYMPILVKNRAAEILFGNIKAEKVYSSYRQQMLNLNPDRRHEIKDKDSNARFDNNLTDSREGLWGSCSIDADKSLQLEEKQRHVINLSFHQIWLIFLKVLLQQGKNSPLKFEITVDPSLAIEVGKFDMVYASMPYHGNK